MTFTVLCCRKRRVVVKGVLVCPICDHSIGHRTTIPNEVSAEPVPEGVTEWPTTT